MTGLPGVIIACGRRLDFRQVSSDGGINLAQAVAPDFALGSGINGVRREFSSTGERQDLALFDFEMDRNPGRIDEVLLLNGYRALC